ncbi:MAG TPA: hypothetical protein VGR56_01060, partial [Nitrososphaerales archaeon]|nr:hypothetical protein [Nitrososphaerales archaeon]
IPVAPNPGGHMTRCHGAWREPCKRKKSTENRADVSMISAPEKESDKGRLGLCPARWPTMGKNHVKRSVPDFLRQFVKKAEFIRVCLRGDGKPPSWAEKTHQVLEVRAGSAIEIVDENWGIRSLGQMPML